MSDIFISYVEEDREVATQIAEMLENAGYTTWSYEKSGLPGHDFISQITQEIAAAKAMVLLISVQAMSSQHVATELFQAYSNKRHVIPLLIGITYDEVKKRQPNWATMLGPSAAMDIDPSKVAKVKPRIIKSLEKKGIYPSAGKEPKPTEELRADKKPPQPSRPDRRDSKQRKNLIIIGAALALLVISAIIVAVIASQSGDKSSHTADTGLPTATPTATITPTLRTTPTPTASLPDILSFSDNFDDGAANGWNLQPGWSVISDNGNYVLDAQVNYGDYKVALPFTTSAENYQLEADFMIISGSLQICVRATGSSNYFVYIGPDHIGVVRGGGGGTGMGIYEMKLELNQWHKVKIALNGGNIKVYIDQTLLLDCQDTDPLPAGTVFFSTGGVPGVYITHVRVDNIVIQPN